MAAVVIDGVQKRYGDVVAVAGVDLRVQEGETFVLVGESGCGKTTLLRMINRLVVPDRGSIHVMGQNIAQVDAPQLRRKIGYVIQHVGLFAHFTVARNVAVVPRLLGWPAERITARVEELLELVGLPAAEFGQRFPRELSGGQRQRIGIARALAADPPLVLLDEPFGALDPITREHMQDEFAALSERVQKTFVLVTHDVFEAVRLGDRIAVMREGKLLRCATPRALVRDPGDPFVEALLGRHRFQLRLMTQRLADLDVQDSAPDDSWPVLGERASVWDALSRCDAMGVAGIRVGRGSDARWLARADLVTAASDARS